MKILRIMAAVVLALLALLHVVMAIAIPFASKADAPISLGKAALMIGALAVLHGAAAWQIWRGKGRGIAWLSAIIGAITVIPLVYLVAEVVQPHFSKMPLEKEQKQRAARGKTELITWALTIPMMVLAGYLFKNMPGIITPKGARESTFVMFLAYQWLIILLHELGHALAGRSVGFRLVSFAVFPLQFTRMGGRPLRWNTELGGHYMGIPERHENLWRRYLWIVAGGPAANVLTFLFCWLVLWWAQGRIEGVTFSLLRGLMCWSLLTAAFNLVPLKLGGYKTDGRHIWEAFFAPVQSRRSLAILGCLTSQNTPVRPREWAAEWVEALQAGEMDASSAVFVSIWAQDRLLEAPQDTAAWFALQRSTEVLALAAEESENAKAAGAYRFHVAWLRLRYDGIVDPAMEKCLENARKDPATDTYELLRLEAALRVQKGHAAEAVKLLEQAEADIRKKPETGLRLSDLEDLRAYRDSVPLAA
jgi:hypothetical protein